MFFNFKFLKLLNKKGFRDITKNSFSEFIISYVFFYMTKIINKLNDQSIEYKNNSKAVLAYTLNNKEKRLDGSQNDFNERDLIS